MCVKDKELAMEPFIELPANLYGITSLLEYRLDTAHPIRELTQTLMRGESTLTFGERELIASVVSVKNCTAFCSAAHTAVADLLLNESQTASDIVRDIEGSCVSEKMKALLQIASRVQESGRAVTKEAVDRAKLAGATDREIHDTVLIAALFCLYNRYVDGLNTRTPEDPSFYEKLGERISTSYMRQPSYNN